MGGGTTTGVEIHVLGAGTTLGIIDVQLGDEPTPKITGVVLKGGTVSGP